MPLPAPCPRTCIRPPPVHPAPAPVRGPPDLLSTLPQDAAYDTYASRNFPEAIQSLTRLAKLQPGVAQWREMRAQVGWRWQCLQLQQQGIIQAHLNSHAHSYSHSHMPTATATATATCPPLQPQPHDHSYSHIPTATAMLQSHAHSYSHMPTAIATCPEPHGHSYSHMPTTTATCLQLQPHAHSYRDQGSGNTTINELLQHCL